MPSLSEALAQPDHRARLAALKAALDAEDRSAPDVIVPALANESNAKVRNAMALVVGKLGSRAHAPALCRLLRDTDAGVRLRAVEGIVAFKDSASYPALVALLVAEQEPKVRDFCAHHLMRLGGDNLMKLFGHMLASDVGWVKESAILALALFNSPRVVPLLRAVCQKEEGPLKELAFKGLEKLSGMGNEAATKAVSELAALREPPLLEVDFANLGDDTTGSAPNFEDTYTGGKLPKIEIASPLEEPDEPEPVQEGSGREKRPGHIKPPTSDSRDKLPVGLVAPPEGGLFPANPPPPEAPPPVVEPEAEPVKGSGRRVRPPSASAGMEPPPGARGRGEDEMRPCPRCGAEVSVGARRCRHCSEVFSDAASPAPEEPAAQVPFDVAFFAVLTLILGLVEARHQFINGVAQDAMLGAIRGILHLAEIAAALGAFRGFSWAWFLWTPLSFFHFVVAASHGDHINAGRAFLCLLSLSRNSTREFCVR